MKNGESAHERIDDADGLDLLRAVCDGNEGGGHVFGRLVVREMMTNAWRRTEHFRICE